MITNAKNDAKRAIRPLPPGQTQTKTEGLGTFLRLTETTGLTKPNKDFNLGQEIDTKNVMPGFARLFSALPGVKAKTDFRAPYNNLIRKKA